MFHEIHDTVYDMALAVFRIYAPGSVQGTRKLCRTITERLVSEMSDAVGGAAWDFLAERGLVS